MGFKLGEERNNFKNSENVKIGRGSVSETPINRISIHGDAMAEANMDGSIDIDPSINLDSPLGRRIMKHEQCHLEQIKSGRAAYGDDWVMWEDKIYMRKEEEGVPVIDGPNGRWPEGHPNHPWEQEAIQAENK